MFDAQESSDYQESIKISNEIKALIQQPQFKQGQKMFREIFDKGLYRPEYENFYDYVREHFSLNFSDEILEIMIFSDSVARDSN